MTQATVNRLNQTLHYRQGITGFAFIHKKRSGGAGGGKSTMFRRLWRNLIESFSAWQEKERRSAALRTRAVSAIAQRQAREVEVASLRLSLTELELQVSAACEQGDHQKAQQLLGEQLRCEQALDLALQSLAQAQQTAEEIKAELWQEHQEFLRRHRPSSSSWTPAIFPVGRDSPDSFAKLVAFLLIATALIALIQAACR